MRRRTWAAAAMLVATIAVGAGANAIDANFMATGWHTVEHGEEGADSTVGNFLVHVHGATSSSQLDDRDLVTSPGAFVVVDLSYATTDAWSAPEEVVLIDAEGREFVEPSGFSSDARVWEAGPDIWLRGTLLFEVPEDAIDGLTLEFRPQTPHNERPATVLQVPLAVSTSSEPLVLESAHVLAEGER